jgi:hypothetical protein
MSTARHHFQKHNLPPARIFYERELSARLSRTDRNGRARTACPFHKGKSNYVFSVNLISGAFNCFSCRVSGGDVVDFLRQRDNLSFKEAAQRLNAWNECPSPDVVRRLEAQAREREQQRLLAEERRKKEHRYLMDIREQLLLSISFQRECENRLDELNAGADQVTANEADGCWAVMALSLDRERMLADEYLNLAGLEVHNGE